MRKIKWAWQRMVRGWDDTALWGLDSHFAHVVIPPLKEFCEEYLQLEKERHELNPERTDVCKTTLELIKKWEEQDYDEMWKGERVKNLASYFAENIGYYWD